MEGHVLVALLISTVNGLYQDRVIGGSDAQKGQFPFQISLRVGGSHVCGGTIITNKFILTAAHCVENIRVQEWVF